MYENGCEKLEASKQHRVAKLMRLAACYKAKASDFEKKIKEVSGFNFEEKQKLYDILINYGVPVDPHDESKEDWQLLKTILLK